MASLGRNQRYCSATCRWLEGSHHQREDRARRRKCKVCRLTFAQRNSRGRFMLYCSIACQTEMARARKAGRPPRDPKGTKSVCAECARNFVGRGGQKFCSVRCREMSSRRFPGTARCARCGARFRRRGSRHRYCSRQCGRKSHKAKRRALIRSTAPAVGRVDLFEIGERDRWICQLCWRPVDPSLRHPDLGAGVLDHALALALGGVHDPANVQLAHHLCNSAKGAAEFAIIRQSRSGP